MAGVEFKAKERKNNRPVTAGQKEADFNNGLSQEMLYDWVDSGDDEEDEEESDDGAIMARSFVEGEIESEVDSEEKRAAEEAQKHAEREFFGARYMNVIENELKHSTAYDYFMIRFRDHSPEDIIYAIAKVLSKSRE